MMLKVVSLKVLLLSLALVSDKATLVAAEATFGTISNFLTQLASAWNRYPWHASCKVEWEVPGPCYNFKNNIINQINAWEGDDLCPGVSSDCPNMPCGQNCLYEFVSEQGDVIKATHKTPVARYIDDLTFTLTEEGGKCKVEGFSTSRLWYAVLDKGTNYCNIRNLMEGAGYTSGAGFKEVTEDSICTQYTSRDCSRF